MVNDFGIGKLKTKYQNQYINVSNEKANKRWGNLFIQQSHSDENSIEMWCACNVLWQS